MKNVPREEEDSFGKFFPGLGGFQELNIILSWELLALAYIAILAHNPCLQYANQYSSGMT
jgi:hypothetical protein